ncbi:MAG: hypothetical protein ACFCUR_03040 [Rhodomicrobiaceae bacterium]
MRVLLAVALLIFNLTKARAEQLDTAVYILPAGGASLVFYTKGCSEENLPECRVADIGCNFYRGGFTATLGRFPENELGSWLKKSNGTAKLKVDRKEFVIKSHEITYSDMDTAWMITFSYRNDEKKIWSSLARAKKFFLIVGNFTLIGGQNQARGIATACYSRKINYGTREGMHVTILSISGLDSENAVIKTRHTREDAIDFCRDYILNINERCIKETLEIDLIDTISANCRIGEFINFFGEPWRFEGRSQANQDPKYIFRNISSNEIADGSSASGYMTQMHIFQALCPTTAPTDLY